MATSTFLDKLSPEIRVTIYSYTFGPGRTVKPRDSTAALGIFISKEDEIETVFLPDSRAPISTSILSASKFVHREAIDVLYRDKTVRGTVEDFEILPSNPDFVEAVRRVEVADCSSVRSWLLLRSTLRRLQVLPNIRSLVILSDCLGFLAPDYGDTDWYFTSVKEFCNRAQLGVATCVDIGRYQLHGQFGKFQIVNRRLVEMWPSVRSTPAGYDACDDFNTRLQKTEPQHGEHNFDAWALQTSLRCWVGMHDRIVADELSGAMDALRDLPDRRESPLWDLFIRYGVTARRAQHDGERFNILDFVDGSNGEWEAWKKPLRDLGPDDGHEVLSRATEYLAKNVAGYKAKVPAGTIMWRFDSRRSFWAMSDSCMDTAEFKMMHQQRAWNGIPDELYIPHPYIADRLIDAEVAYNWIDRLPMGGLLGPTLARDLSPISPLEPFELKQLTYLCLALCAEDFEPFWSRTEPFATKSIIWATSLLRRYLLAPGCLRDQKDAVRTTGLRDLRKTVSDTLIYLTFDSPCFDSAIAKILPPMKTNERTEEDDEDDEEDDDLYAPLAWEHGQLLGYMWLDGQEVSRTRAKARDEDSSSDGVGSESD